MISVVRWGISDALVDSDIIVAIKTPARTKNKPNRLLCGSDFRENLKVKNG
jgi:hypothetical protein